MGFGFGFGIMSIIVPFMFIIVIVIILVNVVKGIGQWNKNNHSPRLTVPVTVVAKRTNVDVSHHHHAGDHHHHHTSTSTTYYVTFQVESGDRMEFHVPGQEYGMLIEGDTGDLTFQGARYLSFERTWPGGEEF